MSKKNQSILRNIQKNEQVKNYQETVYASKTPKKEIWRKKKIAKTNEQKGYMN